MDLGEKDKLDLERKNGVPLNYRSPNISSDWQFSCGNHSNLSMGLVPPERDPIGSSVLAVDPYHPNLWNDRNSQNLGCGDSNVGATASIIALEKGVCETLRTGSTNKAMDLDWNTPKRNGFLQTADRSGTQTSSDFPADPAFTERASRFSSFNAGSFGDIVNPFNISETGMMINGQNMALGSRDVGGPVERGTAEGSLTKGYVSPCDETSKECNEAEASDSGHQVETSMLQADGLHYAFEGQCVKKRKKPSQVMEVERTGGASQLRGESTKDHSGPKQKNGRNPNTTSKDHHKTSDTSKEDYIHVRARRGQATNSHSLAERVRREKISERMKYLQDLVPGCDKVTGKAVMLDEIINYVQSLQRQVEFLSMKLATVIPRLDHTIEGLLTKDIHQSQGSPSMFPFASDANMVHTYLHPSQGSIQAGIPGIGNPLDALRRSVNSQLMAMGVGGYKDPNQVPNPWDDGLNNNVFPMNFGTNGAVNGQDLSGFAPR